MTADRKLNTWARRRELQELMSQKPTTMIGVYVTNVETMQCLPLLSLLAEVSVWMELPAVKSQRWVLV